MERNDYVQQDKTVISGRVVSILTYLRSAIITLSMTVNGARIYPKITVYDLKIADGVRVRSNIVVTGHTQNRGFKGEDDHYIVERIFVADEIRPRYRALNEDLDIEETKNTDGAFARDINHSFIIGRVVSTVVANNGRWAHINIRVRGERTTTRTVTFFQRYVHAVSALHKGDLIAVCGELSVMAKPDRNNLMQQNVVGRDLLILEEVPRQDKKEENTEEEESMEEEGIVADTLEEIPEDIKDEPIAEATDKGFRMGRGRKNKQNEEKSESEDKDTGEQEENKGSTQEEESGATGEEVKKESDGKETDVERMVKELLG